jgi:hypothetical protein
MKGERLILRFVQSLGAYYAGDVAGFPEGKARQLLKLRRNGQPVAVQVAPAVAEAEPQKPEPDEKQPAASGAPDKVRRKRVRKAPAKQG